MLNIYTSETLPQEIDIILDVEAAFGGVPVKYSEEAEALLLEIEKGKWLDQSRFRDRFGYDLSYSELSTGCKGALCVLIYMDKVIDTLEMGDNAISAVIKYCKSGNIFIHQALGEQSFDESSDIEVYYEGKKFSTIRDLNEYIKFPWR